MNMNGMLKRAVEELDYVDLGIPQDRAHAAMHDGLRRATRLILIATAALDMLPFNNRDALDAYSDSIDNGPPEEDCHLWRG